TPPTGGSAGDGEAGGPRDLLAGGEGELQEAEGLELAGAAERTGVDGGHATGGDRGGELLLGGGVVARDENCGRQAADGLVREGRGEGGVERLQHAGTGHLGLDLGGGRAVGGNDQRV